MTRYIALLPDATPLGGICPACGSVMDESGCRIGDHFVGTSPLGISQVVEVFCTGVPIVAVTECPACR
jgi:hypothetical protein